MPKLRHIAIAAEDPEAMAEFYKKAFDFKEVGRPNGYLADGVFLSDGTLNMAILKFKTDQLAALGHPEGHRRAGRELRGGGGARIAGGNRAHRVRSRAAAAWRPSLSPRQGPRAVLLGLARHARPEKTGLHVVFSAGRPDGAGIRPVRAVLPRRSRDSGRQGHGPAARRRCARHCTGCRVGEVVSHFNFGGRAIRTLGPAHEIETLHAGRSRMSNYATCGAPRRRRGSRSLPLCRSPQRRAIRSEQAIAGR